MVPSTLPASKLSCVVWSFIILQCWSLGNWEAVIGCWSHIIFPCLDRIPGTGSFTRPSPNINVGQTLLEILKERYVDEELTAEDLYLGETNVKVDVYDFDRVKKKNRYVTPWPGFTFDDVHTFMCQIGIN